MRKLKRIPVVLAWITVAGAFFLLVLEESGVLVDLARVRLARHLGPLGDGLSIERVSLRWFEPGIVLENLRLHGTAPEGSEDPPEQLLHLERAGLSFGLGRARPLRRLHVEGGQIRISDRLLEGLDAVVTSLARTGDGQQRVFSPPPFAISDFEAELELFDGTLLPLGRASILATPDEDGRYRLRGRVVPVLAGLVSRPDPIYVEGRQWETGLSIRTAATGLSLQSKSFRPPPSFAAVPIEEFSGELTLGASARVDWGGQRVEVTGELRAQLADGRLLPPGGAAPLEEAQCDVDVAFELASGRRFWDRELWAADLRLGASWLGTPVEAWGRFGRELPAETWAHAWARFESLPLERDLLELLGAQPRELRLWDSLAPRGTTTTTIDLRLPPPSIADETPRWRPPAVAVLAELNGAAGMTYMGQPDELGQPQGLPAPVDDIRGRVLFATDPALAHFARLGLQVDGDHGSGRVRAFGAASAPVTGEAWTFDLELQSDSLAVDDTLRMALDGHVHTKNIWPDYQPRGGTVAFTWRLYEDPTTAGLTGLGDVQTNGVRFAWNELPIPFEETTGRVLMLWARESAWRSEDLQQGVRPFGLFYEVTNVDAGVSPSLARAAVRGFVRDEYTRVEAPEDVPLTRPEGITVELDELLLRGRDWDAVAARLPGLAAEVDELGAKGGVSVHFEGGRVGADAPFRTSIEVTPTVTELSPLLFRRRTQDLRGRILLRTEELDGGGESIESVLTLSGRWPGGVELTCHGELYTGLPSRVLIHGAGVDPSNTSFRGALFRALSEGESSSSESMDLAEGSLEGRVDFTVQSELVPLSEIEPTNLYHVHLRDNVLETSSLRLEDLHGVLEQRGRSLGSPHVAAKLAGHPLELRDVRVFRLGDAALLPFADPILQRPTFWSDMDGSAVQADLYVSDLPLDDRHLSSLLDEKTLEVFRESENWRGALDVDGARVVVTSERGGQGKVAVRGAVEPHDLAMRFGIPIEVPRAKVEIEELIFEAGRVRGWGRVEDLAGRFFDRSLSEARMLFSYVDGRMSIDNLAGSFEGGRLESLGGDGQGTRKALAFDLAPPYHFDLALRMQDVEVANLLGGVFQSSVTDAGLIDGGLRLRGTPRDVLGITGGGWFNLDEGRLWSIPVMRELFQQLGSTLR